MSEVVTGQGGSAAVGRIVWGKQQILLRPVGLDQPLHLLRLPLNTDVSLEFPERLIQLHGCEVHFIHHAAEEP